MKSLALLEYGSIRVTENERFSVFDTIEVVGGKKNPWDAWKSLSEQFPEVLGKVEDFKFPGKGQRITPVANTENIFYVIGLLPGAIGRAYREDAAREMCRKYGRTYDSIVVAKPAANFVTASSNSVATQLRALANILDSSEEIKSDVRIIKSNVSRVIADVHDAKGVISNEIRHGNHELSESVKSVQLSLFGFSEEVAQIKQQLAEVKQQTERKPRERQDYSVTVHLTAEELATFVAFADRSGMSRSAFGYKQFSHLFDGEVGNV